MKIAAVGDVHGSKYLPLFESSLSLLKKADLLLLAGDIALGGSPYEFRKVVELVDMPIAAVFGNEEREKELFRKEFPNINFLDDELFQFDGLRIVGSSGVLDAMPYWATEDMTELFRKRLLTLESLLDSSSILFTHFAPTYKTLVGENAAIHSELGSLKMERLIEEKKPLFAIHAHAHFGSKKAKVSGVDIFNVSLPLNRKITVIEI